MRKVQADMDEVEGCSAALGRRSLSLSLGFHAAGGAELLAEAGLGWQCTHSSPALPQPSNSLQNAFGEP